MKRLVAAAAIALACALHTADTRACVAVAAPGSYVRLEAEKTLIVWDARAKVEHFVRKPVFEGDPKAFGFIVPTPVKPEVGKESDVLFARLDAFVPIPAPRAAAKAEAVAAAAAAPVVVEQRVQIDAFELVTLRAADAGALVDWLGKNGFASRPEIGVWAQKYAARDWVFNAMRYTGAEGTRVETPTVRLSFATEKPFYPYTEAPPAPAEEQAFFARTKSAMTPRPLDVWVVAEREVDARAGGKPAGPEKVARAEASPDVLARVLGTTAAWKLEPTSSSTWTITRFHESVVRRTAFEDLVFESSGAQDEDDERASKTPIAFLVVAAAAALGIAIALATDRSPRER